MAQDTGIFIAVPEDIAPKILHEGYQCSRRGRVPAHRNRDGALRAYRRFQRSRPPVLLEVATLPLGVSATPHKDGVKLETRHLPARCLAQVSRSHSTPTSSMMPGYGYQPPMRTASQRPSTPGLGLTGSGRAARQNRLQRLDNVQTLYHATSQSNAINICNQKEFHSGTRGFLGPGIYFSRTASNAMRYCQCRTGYGPRVVLRCQVNLGTAKRVYQGDHTGEELLRDGCDSYEEIGRDCFMLPDNMDGQIDMNSVYIQQ